MKAILLSKVQESRDHYRPGFRIYLYLILPIPPYFGIDIIGSLAGYGCISAL
jgi:hypothetical protein